LDSIADLQVIGKRLIERGYTEADAKKILGGNWLRFLREHLPA
jgi:microsomal dipeptidase-like Zn-dependent dipeptidase